MSEAVMVCAKCGSSVAAGKRFKDSKGRAFCEPCAAALRARAAAKLGTPPNESDSAPPPSPPPIPPHAIDDDGTFKLVDEPALPARSVPREMAICPDCGTPLGSGPICASCGFNRETGVAIGQSGTGTPEPVPANLDAPRRTPKRRERPCVECGYDLTGLKTSKCPECGTINSRYAQARAKDRHELKWMYLKPLIMAAIGAVITCAAYAALGVPVWQFLVFYAIAVPLGFVVYVGCSIAFIGFDEPLGVAFARIAAVFAVADIFITLLDAVPFLGWYAWPIEAFIFTGLLMQVMDIDFEDARVVSIITFVVHLALNLTLHYCLF